MDAQIAKTTQSLTTAAEMENTTQMLMQPNDNWEKYLTPAPLSIAIMGELVFISSNTDFPINKNPPQGGYRYIKYPDSFRACLMQMCNSGWEAFNLAHKNMDQIRILTATVPKYMKTAVDILFQGNDEVVQAMLPNQLENISRIADECVNLANGVEKKYHELIKLIQELLEACVSAEHIYGEDLEKVQMQIENCKMREQVLRELKERSKKAMDDLSKELEEAKDEYKKSMNSLPSGWNMVFMDLLEVLSVGLLGGILSLVADPWTKVKSMFRSQPAHDIKSNDVDVVSEKTGEIVTLTSSLKKYISEDGIDWKELYDQKDKSAKTTLIESQFKSISDDLKKMPESEVRKDAVSLCKRGVDICGELTKYAADQKCDEETAKRLIKDTQNLYEDAFRFDKNMSGSPALSPKPPVMFKERQNSEKQTASQRATENAHFCIEQRREQLNQALESYQKTVEDLEKFEKEENEILIELQNCNIKEINFATAIEMLVKGLDAMGRVKEQWEKMVSFFQMVANIVKNTLKITLKDFVTNSEVTQTLSHSSKFSTKDMLHNQALEASEVSSLVHMISKTYCEVSNRYLMDRVSSLGRLMAMDKKKPEFETEREKLKESCKDAQDGIQQLALKNKEEFKSKTDARKAQIERDLKAILPAGPPEETEKIKEIV